MPRKAVYGKRPKGSSNFVSFTTFAASSPAKTEPNPIEDDATDDRAKRSAELESKRAMSNPGSNRTLQPVDGNARRLREVRIPAKEKSSRAQKHESHAQGKSQIRAEDQGETETKETPKRRVRTNKARSSMRSTPGGDLEQKPLEEALEALRISDTVPPPAETSPTSCPSARTRRHHRSSLESRKSDRKDPRSLYTEPLLRLCNDRQGRKAPTPFSMWSDSMWPYFSITKIAEASYGEVYRLSLKRPHPSFSTSDESVLKLIALKPPPSLVETKKGRKTKKQREAEARIAGMSSVEAVESEVRLLQRMTHVPGFTNFREIRVLQGKPCGSFITAWQDWDEGRPEEKKSIFPDPADEESYDNDQLWAVIEMQDAGTDLEDLRMADIGGIFAVWDIFWGVTIALGKGEEEARFEHRDLHMGNICIKSTIPGQAIHSPSLDNLDRKYNFTGLETTVIDYTLSRAQMTSTSQPEDEDAIAFLDLEDDPAVFDGDENVEYQYAIYRMMRSYMWLDDPLADIYERWDEATSTGRTWKGYHPQTNLVWLHFILHEMMMQFPKRRGKSRTAKGTAGKEFSGKSLEIERGLRELQGLLEPENLPASGLHCVKDLVVMALESGWLHEEDVMAVPVEDGNESLLVQVQAVNTVAATTESPNVPRTTRRNGFP